MMTLTVCDSVCGSGKTTAAINYMNKNPEGKFIFITPFLEEVKRVMSACNSHECRKTEVYCGEIPLHEEDRLNDEYNMAETVPVYTEVEAHLFYEPERYLGAKANGLKELLKHKCNIVTTHALLQKFDTEIIDLVAANGYTLILDEVVDVVEPYVGVKKADKEYLLSKLTKIGKNNVLEWIDDEYDDLGMRFSDIKRLCDLESLTVYGKNKDLLMWTFPIKAFTCFKRILILTYMFDAQMQKYYFDLNGVEYTYLKACQNKDGEYVFKKIDKPDHKSIDKSLVNIYKGDMNDIGNSTTALCANWYKTSVKENNGLIGNLQKQLYNYIRNVVNAKSDDVIWTCYKEHYDALKDKGFTKAWQPMNIRACNNLRTRSTICYLVNVYPNPVISKYLKEHDVVVDSDKYALSEMIQFLWRSCLRDGKPVNLYIPSKRMRNLLLNWLEDGSISTEDRDNESEEEIE